MARFEKATFAAGCFWGVEAYFRRIKGVIETAVGYTGGNKEDPTYEDVCTGLTGHAEAVEVMFDPKLVTFETLLEHFWKIHDPTAKNRQGNDIGTQYRSAVFYHSQSQQKAALRSKEAMERSGRFRRPITTEIVPAKRFYPAESYHQQYLEKNPDGYCHIDISSLK